MMAKIRRRDLDWSNKNWHPIPRPDAVLEAADCHGAIRRRRPSSFPMPAFTKQYAHPACFTDEWPTVCPTCLRKGTVAPIRPSEKDPRLI